MKSYDLCQIKAALPEYLERIFTHTEDRIKAACPFHYGPGCLHEARKPCKPLLPSTHLSKMSSESTPIDEIKAFTPEIENSHPPTSETCKTSETLQVGASPNSFGGNGGCYEEVNGENTPPIPELPALLQDLIAETCKSTLVPSSLAIVPALGILAGSLGGGVRIHRGGGKHTFPNLFLIAIAKSGTGKGQASNLIAKPLHAATAERVELWSKQDLPQIKAELRITSEALALKLEGQPGEAALAFSPEARGAAAVMMGRYTSGKTDEALYLAAFSNEAHPYHRIGRPPVELHHPSLSVTWMIQPDKAAELFGKADLTEGGLLPRFLITDTHAEPEDDPENPHTPDGGTLTQWEELIELALDYRDKAAARLAEFFEIHQPDHVWTWGIDFDCTILRNFLKNYNQRTPWTHWSQRDARTIAQVMGGSRSTPGATHNTLEDCTRQISIVQDCLGRVTS